MEQSNINFISLIRPEAIQADSSVAKTANKFAKAFMIAGLLLILAVVVPNVVFAVRSGLDQNTESIVHASKIAQVAEVEKAVYQPNFDASLPTINMLSIKSAGIETEIHEATFDNFEDALRLGVWRVPDFGDPSNRKRPLILAAHRYGYLKWSIPYRLKNSFYNLPKVEVGDTVEVVWNQRKYVYEIYATENGEEIKDYTADLILYTCQSLGAEEKVFRYGKLLEI